MAFISKKKVPFKISSNLRGYLVDQGREVPTVDYRDLERYNNSIALINAKGEDTLWETVFYSQAEMEEIHTNLKLVYSNLKADGDVSVIKHLYIDRIDICPFGNSKPFRIRIVNRMNDNFDYFYVKNADASRIYGLELEHILSPNRINYMVDGDSLVEEHIAGVPGDQFIKDYLIPGNLNEVRVAKEFVKFNERCFVRLLGDMHSSNFVVEITPDFEEVHYRIRAIDFDQQSFEGRKAVYMPQYFKQNNPFIQMGMKHMTSESVHQYQLEERSLIMSRVKAATRLRPLLASMRKDRISFDKHVLSLREEMSVHFHNSRYLNCKTMGEIVSLNLEILVAEKLAST